MSDKEVLLKGKSPDKVFKTLNWILTYQDLGVKPVPVFNGTKKSYFTGYTKPGYNPDVKVWQNYQLGIGFVTSGKLVDIDCDSIDSLFFAKRLLPFTDAVFGRQGKPNSHYLYRTVGDELKKKAFHMPVDPRLSRVERQKFIRNNTIIEFRSQGHLTVLPGTIHSSGEEIYWRNKENPSPIPQEIQADILYRKVQLVALGAIVVKHGLWGEGSRQNAALYIAGELVNLGYDRSDVQDLIAAICEYEEDHDVSERYTAIQSTIQKKEANQQIKGFNGLNEEQICEDWVVDFLKKLFKIPLGVVDEFANIPKLQRTTSGKIINCESNIVNIIRNHEDLQGIFKLNVMNEQVYVVNAPWSMEDELRTYSEDVDATELAMWMQERGFTTCNQSSIKGILLVAARDFPFHPLKDYFNDLVWDGKERLKYLCSDYMNVDIGDDEKSKLYYQEISKKFLLGAVVRTFLPGEDVQNMLIIQGHQGAQKSRFVKDICPWKDLYAPNMPKDLENKDAMINIKGKMIIEMPELSSFRKSDIETQKAFISRSSDTFRNIYGKIGEDSTRTCIFVGTTNDMEFLDDPTGSRRNWIVKIREEVKGIDITAVVRDKDQLWAEAVHLFKEGKEKHYFETGDELFEQQKEKNAEHIVGYAYSDEIVEEAARLGYTYYKKVILGGVSTRSLAIEECVTVTGILDKLRLKYNIPITMNLKFITSNLRREGWIVGKTQEKISGKRNAKIWKRKSEQDWHEYYKGYSTEEKKNESDTSSF